jgi:alpha-L-fucosidase
MINYKNTFIKSFLFCAIIFLFSSESLVAQSNISKDERMKWWREAKFGMFIHFGTYAQWGGVYHGHKQARGGAEWIMNRAKIPVQEYIDTAKNFNPTKYDADAWAKMAKDAGMKYLVITTKHHDGLALFETKTSKWNTLEATQYGKDLIKPLAEACKKYGLKLGFYYSQSQDWVNPGGATSRKEMFEGWPNPDSTKINAYTAANKGSWDPIQRSKSFDDYINDIAVPQVKELLTNYGEVAVLWWDTPMGITDEQATKLQDVLKLQPNLITNDRLKRPNFPGDTKTPEQKIPTREELDGKDWESCMTMNKSWGYNSWDTNWKSPATLIRNLIETTSKGGNYLLNIGPKPDGSFPEESVTRLKEVGDWMRINKEAIYETKANPFKEVAWGNVTAKQDGKHTILYLFGNDASKSIYIDLPELSNKVVAANYLVDGEKVSFKKVKNGYTFEAGKVKNPHVTVVKVKVKGVVNPQDFKGGKMRTGELD